MTDLSLVQTNKKKGKKTTLKRLQPLSVRRFAPLQLLFCGVFTQHSGLSSPVK